ncbi:MAG: CehA/McbA family metallohydrolase [Deltaproteobacteria bacterium]|nr:CehA/McbA family metallohydrolase [Deltaproteobacteria bacterium]
MRAAAVVVVVAGLWGCGDDGPTGPQPLVPDPAVVVGCAPGPVAGTRAKVVACAEELIPGRLAAGRVGDVVLENAHLRAIVRGAGEGYYLHGSAGGGIVDLARVGGEDLVKEVFPLVDLAGGGSEELVIVEAGDDGPAEVVVRGPAVGLDLVRAALGREPPPVTLEHRIRLRADAQELELETRVYAKAGDGADHELYDALFFGGRAPSFVPGRGFAVGAGPAELVATAGTTTSYALAYPAGTPDPQLIDIANIRLALGPSLDDKGIRRWLIVGDGSIASVTERAWTLRGRALGVVAGTTSPGVDVTFVDGTGPITVARADASGAFRAAVPPGSYTLRATAVGRAAGPDATVLVAEGAEVAASVRAGPSGTLAIAVRDDANAPVPARVLIEPAGGGGARIEWVGASGAAQLAVPPGTWRVSVSRGVEYDAFVAAAVVVADGQTATVAATLPRVVDTAGWISLDTHLHSELSTDSTFPVDDRLRAVAAEGVEVPVSSDHDVVVDYHPIIAELGLGAHLTTFVGTETSSLFWGHINAFPLVVDGARNAGGGPRWFGRSPGQVFAAMHATPGALVQVNHPRNGVMSGLFAAIDLDTTTGVARRDPTSLGLPPGTDLSDLSFDAIEVGNGSEAGSFEEVFRDWTRLVAAGHPAAATGSSDSHGPSAFAGEARTYVFVGAGNDDPATVDPAAILDGIRARHVVVATASFVTAGIVTPSGVSLPGDTVDVTALPQVALRVRVQAAPWQGVARIRIYQGTQEVRAIDLDPDDLAPVRFDADITLPRPTSSTFYVVRVDHAGTGEPVLGRSMPSFTNPLFVRVMPSP